LTPWIEFFTESVVVQAFMLEERLTDWRIMVDEIYRDLVPLGLSERQIDGLVYAERIGYITRKDYIEIANVSPLTATRDLMDMVGRDILQPQGAGRNRKYLVKAADKGSVKEAQQRKLL
jgi:predicted HTH transcriptional regulator